LAKEVMMSEVAHRDFCRWRLVTFLIVFAIGIGVGIVSALLAFIPCIGTVLGVALNFVFGTFMYFAFPIAAFSSVEPVEAVKASFQFAKTHFGPMLLLAVVTGLIAWVGIVACFVGVFFTAPLAMTIAVIAYHEYYLPNAASV